MISDSNKRLICGLGAIFSLVLFVFVLPVKGKESASLSLGIVGMLSASALFVYALCCIIGKKSYVLALCALVCALLLFIASLEDVSLCYS